MKAIQFHEFNGPLTLDEIARPEAGDGQSLVKVAATSFNPVEAAFRAGLMPVELPHIPGLDVSGSVSGRPVIGFLPMGANGAAAEYAIAPTDSLADAPTTIPLTDAAAIPAVALTAWQGLFEHAQLQPGQRVLINGAGGGVGGFAVQFAKQAGATVIATASPRSADQVRAGRRRPDRRPHQHRPGLRGHRAGRRRPQPGPRRRGDDGRTGRPDRAGRHPGQHRLPRDRGRRPQGPDDEHVRPQRRRPTGGNRAPHRRRRDHGQCHRPLSAGRSVHGVRPAATGEITARWSSPSGSPPL